MDFAEEGIAIKMRLKKNNLTQSWLVARLTANDVRIDDSSLSLILNGRIVNDRAVEVMFKSNSIIDRYEKRKAREVR